MATKAVFMRATALFMVLIFSILIFLPLASSHKVDINDPEDNSKEISKGEDAYYIWELINNDNKTTYTVEIEVDGERDDWTVEISEELFDLEPEIPKEINVSVSTSSPFDGDQMKCSIVFKFRSEEENFTKTTKIITTLDIPEDEKKLTLWGFEIPLPEFLNNMWGKFLLSILFWIIAAIITSGMLKVVLARLAKKTDTTLDDEILVVVQTPLLLLITLYGIVDSLVYVELTPELIGRIRAVYDFGTILITVWLCFRLFRIGLAFIAERWQKKKEIHIKGVLIPLIDKLGKAILFIAVVMLILDFFGIDLTVFMAGAGIVGLVIAFAAQDTLANFFSGIFLIIEPKFKTGDTIFYDNDIFIVKHIGLRTTHMYDIIKNIDVIVPNHTLATSKLVNLNEPDKKLRIRIDIPVAYGTDVEKFEAIIDEISEKHPEIITDIPKNEPNLYFDKFGTYSLDFYYIFWIKDLEERFQVRHEVLKYIYKRLNEEGIEIPRPHRIVTFKEGDLQKMQSLNAMNGQAPLESFEGPGDKKVPSKTRMKRKKRKG